MKIEENRIRFKEFKEKYKDYFKDKDEIFNDNFNRLE